MNKYVSFFLYLLIGTLISNDITGYELAKIMEKKEQPKSSKTEISMTLINLKKDRKKTKEMFSISKDDGDKMLLFFKTPKRDKGVGFLKIESDEGDKLSLFIPKLKKIRRVSSNNQSDSFMGSDLSFEDMLSRDFDDFTYKIISKKDDGMYILETKSKLEDSEYSRHISWVTKSDLLIKKEESYDKSNKLLKEKVFEHTLIKGYYVVSKIDVTNIQDQHRTILEINTLGIDEAINDDIFQDKNLKRYERFVK